MKKWFVNCSPMDYLIFFVLVPRVYNSFSSKVFPFLPSPILLYFWNFSNTSNLPFVYLPHTICTIRAFALNVRTSGVSATSADPRRLEPLIH